MIEKSLVQQAAVFKTQGESIISHLIAIVKKDSSYDTSWVFNVFPKITTIPIHMA